MSADAIFEKLWKQYSNENPSALRIHELLRQQGERIVNDHVAFRTFNDPRVDIEVLARPFLAAGYQPAGEYHFKAKKLHARHYEVPGHPELPRVFISELKLEECSNELQETVAAILGKLDPVLLQDPELIMKGSVFGPLSYTTYQQLREESEYAAWLYAWGFRANHFTVSINYLQKLKTIEALNDFLKQKGFEMNSSGGEIKGSPEQFLQQSSTLADRISLPFADGKQIVPSCYYEFARRFDQPDGKLFSAFIADSADKIFESTDYR